MVKLDICCDLIRKELKCLCSWWVRLLVSLLLVGTVASVCVLGGYGC